MVGYYCKKCKAVSAAPTCQTCGVKLPVKSVYAAFHETRLPALDGYTWRCALTVLVIVILTLVLTLICCEFALGGAAAMAHLLAGALMSAVVLSAFAGVALIAITLCMQGREENYYTMDEKGVHLQTWVRDSRVKCFSRMQSYAKCAQTRGVDAAGQGMLMVENRCLPWSGVQRVLFKRGRICLYATSPGGGMFPRPPEDESLEDIAKLVDAMLRQQAKKQSKKP